jgi:hypothetical protein
MVIVACAALPGVGYAQDPGVNPAACCEGAPRDPNLTCFQNLLGWLPDQFRSMPQTCYSPSFGCYPGNGRDIQRYPPFHGTYYRRAYNYRQLNEWPWMAEPHQPAPLSGPYLAGAVAMPGAQHTSPFIEESKPGAETVPLPPSPPAPTIKN